MTEEYKFIEDFLLSRQEKDIDLKKLSRILDVISYYFVDGYSEKKNCSYSKFSLFNRSAENMLSVFAMRSGSISESALRKGNKWLAGNVLMVAVFCVAWIYSLVDDVSIKTGITEKKL